MPCGLGQRAGDTWCDVVDYIGLKRGLLMVPAWHRRRALTLLQMSNEAGQQPRRRTCTTLPELW